LKKDEFLVSTISPPSEELAKQFGVKAEMVVVEPNVEEFYKSVGCKSAKILFMEQQSISDDYSTVKVHWGLTLEKTGKNRSSST